jgi:predicted nucleic acid-binding protein
LKVFLDTNVLVASVLNEHDFHSIAFPVLERVQNETDNGFISAHSLAEMYAVLTRLPAPLRHSPEQALLNIEENVIPYFKIIALTAHDYVVLLREAALVGVQGGTVHDAVLLKAAIKSDVEQIFTFNKKHFEALAPEEIRPRIFSPGQ